jgi:pre-mRNA-splicing factor 38B
MPLTMSRTALHRQEGGSRGREIRAEEIFETACEEGRRKSSSLPLWGDDTSFHFNPLLLQNCILSPYFQKCCENLKDWNAVIDEIYYEVKSVQVFQVGKQPSTAFCLLLRLLTLRMTSHQLNSTLKHVDSPYIRAIGFLYLRYVGQPDQVYKWIEPYLQDCEEFTVGQRDPKIITMGTYVRFLFQSRDYYGQTTLPRYPIAIERELQVKLLAEDKIYERAIQHYKNSHRMKQFQTIGCKVMALYGDEENPITWYPAEVDRVITHDEKGPLKYPKFVVTFTEYGNTETVSLGELDALDAHSSIRNGDHSDAYMTARYDRHQIIPNVDLYDEVRRREREQVVSSGRGSWSRRPPTTKESLSSQQKHHSNGSTNADTHHANVAWSKERPTNPITSTANQEESNQERKRTAEEIATIAEKKRKLIAKYG